MKIPDILQEDERKYQKYKKMYNICRAMFVGYLVIVIIILICAIPVGLYFSETIAFFLVVVFAVMFVSVLILIFPYFFVCKFFDKKLRKYDYMYKNRSLVLFICKVVVSFIDLVEITSNVRKSNIIYKELLYNPLLYIKPHFQYLGFDEHMWNFEWSLALKKLNKKKKREKEERI